MKANSKFFLFLTVLLIILLSVSVEAQDYITSFKTPETASLKWAVKIGEGWAKPAGVPLLVEDDIVIISGDELLRLNSENGEITQTQTMDEAQSYGYVAPTYADGKIFMNLSNGTVQAFDALTFEPEWTYVDVIGGKGMTNVTYSDNLVFTGFWNGENKDGAFVALDSNTGELKWSKTINGGFYWAGAYCTEDAVIFGTDDGSDKIAHIYSCNKETGEVLSQIDVFEKGDIRSSVKYCNGRIYVTTKGGYIISASLTEGILSDVKYGEIGSASTSTPVIYKDRIYIGAADKTISVFDVNSLEKFFSVDVTAYPQCTPLISNYYEETEGYLYLYTTYNKTPGGVTLIKIKTDAESNEDCVIMELYDAQGFAQYCISDIIADKDGTLYYKNDSGYLFALEKKNTEVFASITEDGFVFPKTKLKVTADIAESYGYTDTVAESASALDVLVKIHEELFGDEFTPQNANDYLSVSEEGYLSRVMCIDTYNFGFAVNGKAPHDDILTEYGYTGYSLNQAAVNKGDKIEFFLYRDSWAMDNYVHFEKEGISIDKATIECGEEISLTLKGYPIGWYGCYEDSQIENMMLNIGNAEVTIVDQMTGVMEKIAETDENGNVTLSFKKAGKYVISALENNGSTPIIAPWLEIDVKGLDIEITEDKKTVIINSNLSLETDCLIIISERSDLSVTKAKVLEATLPDEAKITDIDTSDFNGEIEVFVWDKNLVPVK